ncbi:MAG: radical SAM protein [Theionarchaea archaeon]|nr:MAG: hypothetical protein AYK19_11085 [Theionarchaea archaeon DG-70-1]MBU7028344.1 radical SAM protein [Theionarchaea archaeon]
MTQPPLKTLYWYVTTACNQHCKHCWVSAGKKKAFELTAEQWIQILDGLIDIGLENVKITGGEPLLHWKKIKKVMEFLTDHQIRIRMETNATLLCGEHSRDILTFLQNEHIQRVAISLDSHIPEQHDYFREMNGAFDKTLRGLTLLKENEIPFSVVTVLHSNNYTHIEDIIDFVGTIDPCHHLIDLIIPEGRSKVNTQYQLTADFYVEKLPPLIKRIKKERGKKVIFNIPLAISPLTIDFVSCTVGKEICGLLPNGDISICGVGIDKKELTLGNVLEDDIEDIWVNSPAFLTLRKSTFESKGICGNCIFGKYCMGHCRALTYSVYGQLDAPYPICQKLYEEGVFPQKYLIDPEKDCAFHR